MINTIIALLVELDLLTEAEGEELALKVRQGTLPQDFPSSRRQVKQWLKEVKEGVA